MMSTSLRNFTSDNVEVSLDNITSIRFGDYLNSIPLPAMLSVFKAEEWDNYGLLVVDSALIYSVVDVLLGGRPGPPPGRISGPPSPPPHRAPAPPPRSPSSSPPSPTRRRSVARLVGVVLRPLPAAVDLPAPDPFGFDRLEPIPGFAPIARPANAAILARLRIDMEDRGGRLELMLPYATLEPVRELLLQQFMGEKFGRDSIWETHLAEELWNTEVELDVVLDEQSMRLGDIIGLKPGSKIG